ncbi:hypothetical protein RJT34_06649 [Clitoria ternatea]|uniref:CCHC-type domain-containing protein n=1 Tax=Clitoria ternatea TaxID=43366 RepID=A0AAN9K4C0_CLITE
MVTKDLSLGSVRVGQSEFVPRVFHSNLSIPIALEEYESRCRPWLLVVIVKLLGKRAYEGLNMICVGCGHYGHKIDSCAERVLRLENISRVLESGVSVKVPGSDSSANVMGDGGTSVDASE